MFFPSIGIPKFESSLTLNALIKKSQGITFRHRRFKTSFYIINLMDHLTMHEDDEDDQQKKIFKYT